MPDFLSQIMTGILSEVREKHGFSVYTVKEVVDGVEWWRVFDPIRGTDITEYHQTEIQALSEALCR